MEDWRGEVNTPLAMLSLLLMGALCTGSFVGLLGGLTVLVAFTVLPVEELVPAPRSMSVEVVADVMPIATVSPVVCSTYTPPSRSVEATAQDLQRLVEADEEDVVVVDWRGPSPVVVLG